MPGLAGADEGQGLGCGGHQWRQEHSPGATSTGPGKETFVVPGDIRQDLTVKYLMFSHEFSCILNLL